MGVWIGLAVLVLVVLGLAWLAQRRRRGSDPSALLMRRREDTTANRASSLRDRARR